MTPDWDLSRPNSNGIMTQRSATTYVVIATLSNPKRKNLFFSKSCPDRRGPLPAQPKRHGDEGDVFPMRCEHPGISRFAKNLRPALAQTKIQTAANIDTALVSGGRGHHLGHPKSCGIAESEEGIAENRVDRARLRQTQVSIVDARSAEKVGRDMASVRSAKHRHKAQRPDGRITSGLAKTRQGCVVQVPAVVVEVQVERQIARRAVAAAEVQIPAGVEVISRALSGYAETRSRSESNVFRSLRARGSCQQSNREQTRE